MNPLLFANLSNQRRLLRSGTAYETARKVVDWTIGVMAVGGVIALIVQAEVFRRFVGVGGGAMPEGMGVGIWVVGGVAVVGYAGAIYLWRAVAHAFFDIADACLAISLQRPEEHGTAVASSAGPRQGGGKWPERPKPLIPVPEARRPEDVKYMPKG